MVSFSVNPQFSAGPDLEFIKGLFTKYCIKVCHDDKKCVMMKVQFVFMILQMCITSCSFDYFFFVAVPLKAPFITEPLDKHVMITAGRSFSVVCSINGEPFPNITWFRNGDALLNSSDTVLTSDGKLTILLVRKVHVGMYYCSGINDLGSISTDTINVTVACKFD